MLRHFAANGYGDFEWVDHLRWISKPMLIADRPVRAHVHGRAGRGDPREVAGSQLVVIEKAAHMTFVEQPKAYQDAIREWFTAQGVIGQEQPEASA